MGSQRYWIHVGVALNVAIAIVALIFAARFAWPSPQGKTCRRPFDNNYSCRLTNSRAASMRGLSPPESSRTVGAHPLQGLMRAPSADVQNADGSVLGGVVDVSETGIAGGVAIGARVSGAGAFGRAVVGLRALRLGAAFLATGLALAFLGAALTAFFAAFTALPARFAFAFATGRFLDSRFFAIVTLPPGVRSNCESSPEKVCCHLRVKLESATRIA